MEVRSVFVNSLHTHVAHHILPIPQTPYFYYSKVHVVGFLQHFELERPSNCEISHWVSRWSIFVRRCSLRGSQRISPWNGLFVWVTTGVKFSRRHLCATLFLATVILLKCSLKKSCTAGSLCISPNHRWSLGYTQTRGWFIRRWWRTIWRLREFPTFRLLIKC